MPTQPNTASSSRREESRVYQNRSGHRLCRDAILFLLGVLGWKLYQRCGEKQTTLVVHGGIVSVFRKYRKFTATIDYIADTLPKDLGEIIKECVAEIAHEHSATVEKSFGIKLKRDWMNSDAQMLLRVSPREEWVIFYFLSYLTNNLNLFSS